MARMKHPGLGRRQAPDPRDRAFPLRAAFPLNMPSDRTYRYWNADGWWGDQGSRPHCVGYGWTHVLEDGPFTHTEPSPLIDPTWLYHAAQDIDEWPGTDYDGTSVRAGAKVLHALGFIESYWWAHDSQSIARFVLDVGPMVMGTDWHRSMFEPDPDGVVALDGNIEGGHCWVLDGVNMKAQTFRGKNSWGRGWGKKGFFTIRFEDMDTLMHNYGEACAYVESSPYLRRAVLSEMAADPDRPFYRGRSR